MTDREMRGQAIADACQLDKRGDMWLVPSQSSGGKYAVHINPDLPTCRGPDYELRGMTCTHIFAVECVIKKGVNARGEHTVTRTVTVTETVKKPTYTRDWPAYNAAQTHEKDKFQILLADLCRGLQDATPRTKGQPRLPLCDMIFACCFKVYSTVSGRRFMSDPREATERGYLSRSPHDNSIFNYLENPAVGDTAGADARDRPAAQDR